MPFIPLFTLGFASLGTTGEDRHKCVAAVLIVLSAIGFLLNIPAVLTTAAHCLKGFSPAQEWANVAAGRYSTFPLFEPIASALLLLLIVNALVILKGGRDYWSRLFAGRKAVLLLIITVIALTATFFAFGKNASRYELLSIESETKMYPDSFSAHYVLGQSYLSRGMKDKALGEIRKASALEPEHAGIHFSLGYLYLEKPGFSREAMAEFRSVIEYSRDPSEVSDAHTNIGNILAQKRPYHSRY